MLKYGAKIILSLNRYHIFFKGKDMEIKSNYTKEYLTTLTNTILSVYFKNMDLLNDTELLIKTMNSLLDENDNSLFKQQVQRFASIGLDNIIQNGKNIPIDFEKYYTDLTRSNLLFRSIALEEKININSIKMNNYHILPDMKFSFNEAKGVLNCNIDYLTQLIKKEINNWNTEQLLNEIYSISSLIALFSGFIFERFLLKGDNEVLNAFSNDYFIIIQTIQGLTENELKIVSNIIAQEKMNCDILFNMVYDLYLEGNENKDKIKNANELDIMELFAQVTLLSKMHQLFDPIALLYENKYYLYMKDFCLYANDDFQMYLSNFFTEIINYKLPEKVQIELQNKYKQYLGYNADNLGELISFFERKQGEQGNLGITIEKYNIEELKNITMEYCKIEEKAVIPFLNALLLSREKKDIDYKNKLSIFPLVKLKNEDIIFSVPLLIQAWPMLFKRMSQNSYINDIRMKKYFQKNYDEFLLNSIKDTLEKHDIDCRTNVHLDMIDDNEVKEMFVNGISKEVDLSFIMNDSLYIVEYKNWATTAFSLRGMLKEYKKVEHFVNSHLRAIEIIQNNLPVFKNLFNYKLEGFDSIKLIMVFQAPNAFNYLNKNNNVKGYTLNDFIKCIEKNQI